VTACQSNFSEFGKDLGDVESLRLHNRPLLASTLLGNRSEIARLLQMVFHLGNEK
jgi:hypothetical protein